MSNRNDKNNKTNSGSPPLLNLTLWPNRSLTKRNFYGIMLITFSAMMIPIIPFIGTKAIFIFLPFSLVTIFLLFFLIKINYHSGKLYENVKIWPNLIEVKRYESNGTSKQWQANPYWTKITLYEESQKIKNYLTLSGSGREIEVGSFLAPSERLEIKREIETVFKKI